MGTKRPFTHLRSIAAAALALAATLTACETINDDLEPCRTEFRVKFRYDLNIKYADAFAHEVESVALWIFDTSGRPVWHGTEAGEALRAEGYAMPVDIAPGTYDLVAWCGLEGQPLYRLAGAEAQRLDDLRLSIARLTDAEGDYVADDLTGLYNGFSRVTFAEAETGGVVDATLPLTKNTNVLRITLQHYNSSSDKQMAADDFDFAIEAANAEMNYDNRLLGDDAFAYRNWIKTPLSADFGTAALATRTTVNGLMAERTIGRLTTDREQMLVVRRTTDGEQIIRLPLIKYLLMVRGNYNRHMEPQEYLDRVDEYEMTFFLDGDDKWYTGAGIYINSWMVVPEQDTEM